MTKLRLLLLFVLSLFIFCGCGINKKETNIYKQILDRDNIRIGVKHDSKPFGYINENGDLVGVDIDIAKELTKRLLGDKSKVTFVEVSPSSRIKAITSGEVDIVIATMTVTPQRKLIVDFSEPYYTAGQAFVVHKNSKINSFHDLNKKDVAVVLATTSERNLRQSAPLARVHGFKTYKDAFDSMINGETDAVTADDSILLGFVMDCPDYKIIPKKLTNEPYAIAFKKSEDAASLKNNINQILTSMKEDGFINKTKRKWNLK